MTSLLADQDSFIVAPTPPPRPLPPATTTSQPLEVKYHLGEGFTWVLSLLNDDESALEFSSNGKNVTLEVSRDSNVSSI